MVLGRTLGGLFLLGGFALSTACESSWEPPDYCRLPFDAGTCEANVPVYAFVDGACVERTYGGCDGNANRFFSLEVCMQACQGYPSPNGCPDGRRVERVCVGCGPIGNCSDYADLCVQTCSSSADCQGSFGACTAGTCQPFACL